MAARSARKRRRSRRRSRRRRGLVAAVLVVLLAGAGAGYAYLDIRDVVPGVLTDEPVWPQAEPFPTAELPAAPTVTEVLGSVAPTAPVPTAQALVAMSAGILADPRVGPNPALLIQDVLTGEDLLAANAAEPRVPASTLKLLAGVAALETMGPEHTFRTTAVDAGDGSVVLVASGDVMLAAGAGDPTAIVGRAGLADLAAQVAQSLGTPAAVRVVLDDSLFVGPTLAPNWGEGDLAGGWAMPIAPIAVNIGIVPDEQRREADPGLAAARAFAAALTAAGLTVSPEVTRGTAPASAVELGAVESAPLRDVVAYTLQQSENIVAEVLGRMTAHAVGGETSFAGAGEAVRQVITSLGVDTTGVSLADTSGLSSHSTLTARVLTDVVRLAADGSHPELISAIHALPVAALEGTLADRLGETDAAGWLAAKTGTLPQVVSLAGMVVTVDGRLLAFSIIANGFERGSAYHARLAVDEWAASLAACGCTS